MDWLELPPKSYKVAKGMEILSYCQIEVTVPEYAIACSNGTVLTHRLVSCEKISLQERTEGYCEPAPLRILYLDVKTRPSSTDKARPMKSDPIVQIVSLVRRPGTYSPLLTVLWDSYVLP